VLDSFAFEQLPQFAAAAVLQRVIGHQPLGVDVVSGVEGQRALEESDHGCRFLVVMDLGVGEP
jgi:hypothetical protein